MRYIYEHDMPKPMTEPMLFRKDNTKYLRRRYAKSRFKPNGITDNRDEWREKNNQWWLEVFNIKTPELDLSEL